MKRIPRICSVRARDSTPDEPGRSFFVHDLGTLLAPAPDWCAVTKQSSGLVENGVIGAEAQIRQIRSTR